MASALACWETSPPTPEKIAAAAVAMRIAFAPLGCFKSFISPLFVTGRATCADTRLPGGKQAGCQRTQGHGLSRVAAAAGGGARDHGGFLDVNYCYLKKHRRSRGRGGAPGCRGSVRVPTSGTLAER